MAEASRYKRNAKTAAKRKFLMSKDGGFRPAEPDKFGSVAIATSRLVLQSSGNL